MEAVKAIRAVADGADIKLFSQAHSKARLQLDNILIKSSGKQAVFFVGFVVVSFGFLLLLRFCAGDFISITRIPDLIFEFINAGDTYIELTASREKILALIMGVTGMIFFNGLLIPVCINIITFRIDKIKNGETAYSVQNHFVIIGCNAMSKSLIKQLSAQYPHCYIIIATEKNIPDARSAFETALSNAEQKRLIFIHGNGSTKENLDKLCLIHALRIFILGDSGSEKNYENNIDCVQRIAQYIAKNKNKRADVLINDDTAYTLLRKTGIKGAENTMLDFRPVFFYELWAQKVLSCSEAYNIAGNKIEYTRLDGNGIDYDSESSVHLVIIGMNNMGAALAVEAARIAHFPNFIRDSAKKTRITIIDADADIKMRRFAAQHSALFEIAALEFIEAHNNETEARLINDYQNNNIEYGGFLDVSFCFIKGSAENTAVRTLLSRWAREENTILSIAVCESEESAKESAACLPAIIFERSIPVYIHQETTSALFTEIIRGSLYANIYPFGMSDDGFLRSIDDVEARAMRVMWVYNTYYNLRDAQYGEGLSAEAALTKLLQTALAPKQELTRMWRDAKISDRWASIHSANALAPRLRSFPASQKAVTQNDLELIARVEHNRWNIERLIYGFRATTKTENADIAQNAAFKNQYKKERWAHYDIRPYEELQEDEAGNDPREYDICIGACMPKIIGVEDGK